MDPRRPNLTLRDFFLHEQRMVAEAQIDSFFKHAIRYLIVSNVILGSFTVFNLYIYPNYIYDDTPEVYRDISTIPTSEV